MTTSRLSSNSAWNSKVTTDDYAKWKGVKNEQI